MTTIDSTTEITRLGRRVDARGAADVLASAGSVSVICHVHPDADSVGAGLALALVLERDGTPVQVSFATPSTCRTRCACCPAGTCWSRRGVAPRRRPGGHRRRAEPQPAGWPRGARRTPHDALVIDHHKSNMLFGTVNYVDPKGRLDDHARRRTARRLGQDHRRRRGLLPLRRSDHRHRLLPLGHPAGAAAGGPAGRDRRRQRRDQPRAAGHPSVRLAAAAVTGAVHRAPGAGRRRPAPVWCTSSSTTPTG